MTVLSPPAFLQAGTYSALLDRMHLNTQPTVRDFATLHRARQGFWASRYPTYTNPSGMDISISACSGLIANTFITDGGDYRFVNPTALTVTLAASSPTQNRIDVVGFRVFDNFYDASGLNQVVPAVIQGANSAGAPSAPSLPASFIPVVECLVNATATSPNTLTDRRQRTASENSNLLVGSATERTAIGTPYEGLFIDRTDRDWLERYDGAAWRVVNQPALVTSTADRDSAITNPVAGTLAMIGASGQMYRHTGSAWTIHQLYRENQTLGADTATVTFSSIPTNLRRLVLSWTARGSKAAVMTDMRMRINNNSGNNYRASIGAVTGTTPANFLEDPAAFSTIGHFTAASDGNNIYGGGEVRFNGWDGGGSRPGLNWVYESHAWSTGATAVAGRGGGLYFQAGPFNRIDLFPDTGNFKAGSEFTLYGWE